VVAERKCAGGEMVLVFFDLLHLRGKSVMRELWRDRRTRLEDLLDGRQLPRVAVVPVTDDAPRSMRRGLGWAPAPY
jgi:ATP-dependent DNA ligase